MKKKQKKYLLLIIVVLTLLAITVTEIYSSIMDKKVKKINSDKNAIVVLTRGYKTKNEYKKLITRNKHLEKYFNKNISYIIFHEGNISTEHQKYIQNKTKIPLQFINVKDSFNFDNSIKFDPDTRYFKLGYRNMCNFWFSEFWKYVDGYDKILRIDEDCNYMSNYNIIFEQLNNKVSIYGHYANDADFVTKGLNKFTQNFLKMNGFNNIKSRTPSGPYTNVIGFNINKLKTNDLLFEYIKAVKESNNIYIYRWGDLPLWGEALYYFFKKDEHLLLNRIKYFHESHGRMIN